jgi:hypothetical protein
MKIRAIIFSQVVRLLRATRPAGGFYAPSLVAGIVKRYGFAKYPESIGDLLVDANKAVEFQNGRILIGDTECVIDKLSIHSDGVVVASRAPVESTEHFCNDLLGWAEDSLNVTFIDNEPSRVAYTSQLEVEMTPLFLEKFAFLNTLGSAISGALAGYALLSYDFKCSGFSLHFDQIGKPIPPPGVFQIERRGGQPFEKNVFFSQAPLKTKEHARLLEMIEKL